MGDGKITLTLGELKEYFKIWHENLFSELHTQKIKNIITEYLNQSDIPSKINIIDSIKTTVINVGSFLSKTFDGESDLSNSSTLENVVSELNRKYNNFKASDYNTLKAISNALSSHTTSINSLSQQKANKEYVDTLINQVNNSLGVVPKEIQTQDIPVAGFGSDLNNYKVPGLYRSKTAANTSSLGNVPAKAQNSAFSLVILRHMDNSARQLLLTSETSNVGNSIFTRNYIASSNSWSEWYELYGKHNTQPLQMKIEWSDSSQGSTTYTLLQIKE